jgi:glycerol-3-phosphate acyltransferase PlsY
MKVILTSFIIILGYLIGSVPPGAWLAKFYGRDITKHGSGNIGATNVGRLFGASGFVFVFLLDALKAYLFLKVLQWLHLNEFDMLLAALGLLIGNSFSIFLQGHGGKGVATSTGILLALNPLLCLLDFICWIIFFGLTKTVGISSVAAYACLPIILFAIGFTSVNFFIFVLFLSGWGIMRHRTNIAQYIA